jgi:hypothetical protein
MLVATQNNNDVAKMKSFGAHIQTVYHLSLLWHFAKVNYVQNIYLMNIQFGISTSSHQYDDTNITL